MKNIIKIKHYFYLKDEEDILSFIKFFEIEENMTAKEFMKNKFQDLTNWISTASLSNSILQFTEVYDIQDIEDIDDIEGVNPLYISVPVSNISHFELYYEEEEVEDNEE